MNAPILYPAGTTSFTTNGLGQLSDAISCRIQEKENGLFELSMVYPVDGIHFSDIVNARIIYAQHVDGPQPFEIYKISKPLNGKVEINAQHATYGLSMIPAFPGTAASASEAMDLLETSAGTIMGASCPYTFWTDNVSSGSFTIEQPTSIRALLGGQEGSILDVYGGQFEWDHFTVKLHAQRGSDNGVTILYGKNLLDLTQEENIQNTYTGIAPFWRGMDDNQQQVIVTLTEKVRYSSNAGNFPYPRVIPVDFSSEFQDQPTETQLRSKADEYISANGIGVPSVSIKISLVDLWQTEEYKNIAPVEQLKMCDLATVEFDELGVSAKARVVETDWDVLQGRYNSVTVGDARSTLASSIRSSIDAVQADIASTKRATAAADAVLQAAIERASDKIKTGLGGIIMDKNNANGQREELLILCDDNVTPSTDYMSVNKIWRVNKNGIGYSSNGYNGTFNLAMTSDGEIVADRITTGSMSATRIKGGTLSLGGASNGNGTIDLYDAHGNIIAHMDNTGATFNDASVITNGSDSRHTLQTSVASGNISMKVDGHTLLMMGPAYDLSDHYTGSIGLYYPLTIFGGSGGSVDIYIPGIYGNSSEYGNKIYIGRQTLFGSNVTITGDLTVNGTIHN